MYVDFHIHTNYSDGGKSYDEIVELCLKNNIKYISITDHNTYLAYINHNEKRIKMLPGIEVDVLYKNITLHFFVYNFDINSKYLFKYYEKNRKHEIKNFNKLLDELNKKFFIKIDSKIKKDFIKNNNYFDIIRVNNLLCKNGNVKTPQEAFYKYTKYLPELKRRKLSIKELFKLANNINGIVVLAHSLKYKLSLTEMKKIILDLKNNYGLKAIEAINNRQTLEEEKELINFCNKNNLYYSAGSDSHYHFGEKVPSKNVGIIQNRKIKEDEVTFLKLL